MPNLTPEQEMQQRYTNVFASREGQLVLGDIMRMGHFGDNINPNDPAAVAEYNFANTIARMSGAFNALYAQLGLELDKENNNGR